jgi:hypothetical protein
MHKTIMNFDEKIEYEVFGVIKYKDLEAQVKKTFGKDWSFMAAEETWENGSNIQFDVSASNLDKFEKEELDNWYTESDPTVSAYILLQVLAQRGIISPGKYLVQVSW